MDMKKAIPYLVGAAAMVALQIFPAGKPIACDESLPTILEYLK